jgi:hypothetical protein
MAVSSPKTTSISNKSNKIHQPAVIPGSLDSGIGGENGSREGIVGEESEQPDVPYRDDPDFEWTKKAFEMLTDDTGGLRGEATAKGGITSSRVSGYCPRCRPHELDDQQTHSAVTNLLGGEWRGVLTVTREQEAAQAYLTVDVTCGCGKNHPGAPAGLAGCGVTFRVELPVHSLP